MGKKSRWMVVALGIWTLVLVVAPLCYIVAMSFAKRDPTWGIDWSFTLDNYAGMWKKTYLEVFRDSIVLAASTTILTLLLGYPFAYSTARLSPRFRMVVLLLLMAPFWLNSLVRMYGWMNLMRANGLINAGLQAAGVIQEPLKLLYNNGAVLLGMVYGLIPMMMLAIYNSTEKIDWSLVEAARDLGASRLRAFLTVTLPQCLPGIGAGCVLVFVPSMALFFISDLMGGAKTVILGNLIKNVLLVARDWPFAAALSVVMMVATAVIVVIYRKIAGKKSLEGLI